MDSYPRATPDPAPRSPSTIRQSRLLRYLRRSSLPRPKSMSVYDLGHGQWDIPDLRRLLTEILPDNDFFEDFEVKHDFPTISPRHAAQRPPGRSPATHPASNRGRQAVGGGRRRLAGWEVEPPGQELVRRNAGTGRAERRRSLPPRSREVARAGVDNLPAPHDLYSRASGKAPSCVRSLTRFWARARSPQLEAAQVELSTGRPFP